MGTEYVVLALWFDVESTAFGRGLTVVVPNDSGRPQYVPIGLFEVTDARPSGYWSLAITDHGLSAQFAPPSILENPYYYDDLSNGDKKTADDFDELMRLLASEFEPPEY